MMLPPPRSTLFPYTTLFRSANDGGGGAAGFRRQQADFIAVQWQLDRKSTRLNSSHGSISYAVFCLKKKKNSPQFASTPTCPSGESRLKQLATLPYGRFRRDN